MCRTVSLSNCTDTGVNYTCCRTCPVLRTQSTTASIVTTAATTPGEALHEFLKDQAREQISLRNIVSENQFMVYSVENHISLLRF